MLQHNNRFAGEHRLKKPAEYQQLFRSPCRSTDKIFLVIARKSGLNYARLGVAIPKKWIKKAVKRNKLKRLVRESFRKNQRLLYGLDVVVVVNTPLGTLINKSIYDALEKHWQRLVICKKS